MKVRGRSKNRNTVKGTVENGQKISGDKGTAIIILVPGVKKSRLQDGLEFDRA